MSEVKKIATRESYGETLVELGAEHEEIVVLDADLAAATKTGLFQAAYPERFINCGIAESNMIGVAAGLAAAGKVPFASSFAMFAAGRAYEQVRNSVGYPHLNVKIGATHAGISVGEDGATHQCNEDIALMRTIPGMVVINPSDDIEARAAVRAAYEYVGPVYMRFGRLAVPVINDRPDITDPENPVLTVSDGSIEFDHVDFSYKKQSGEPVLKDINLQIASGETIGILGGTGSAKSSLVNLVSRLYDVTEGSVRVGGVDVRNYGVEALRNQVAVVLQNNVLFSGTLLDNLRWGDPEATEEECKHACELACADEFIQKMPKGYHTYIEQGGTNVSGGQKQRLCIARALLKKPKVLILDDSTSAVDTATDASIRRAFAEEIPGTTKLIIAQRISSIQNCDRIIVMEDGRVNDFGAHEELLARNQIYQEIYESQAAGNADFDEPGKE